MRGLLAKTLHEVWLPTLLFGCSLLAVKGLLTFILPQIQQGFGDILDQIPFLRSLLAGLLGTELGEELNARTLQAFLWVHPVVLALVWGHEIAFCTRMPAGEIDRGTIDVLFSLPVSRRTVYVCESLVWLATEIGGVLEGRPVSETVEWVPDIGLTLGLRLDALGAVRVTLVSGIGLLVCLFSHRYFF